MTGYEQMLIEAVARAICEAEKMNPDDALGGWRHWEAAAVAAIASYRNYDEQL